MFKFIIYFVGVSYIINGLYMWFAPHHWYENVPGIIEMGLYHKHLVRDVGIAYLVMGTGILWAFKNASVAFFACIWPALHAVYHVVIFFQRGMLIDDIAMANLFFIQLPAWTSLWVVYNMVNVRLPAIK